MISVIIPTLNEAEQIRRTVRKVQEHGDLRFLTEIIVADGGSDDGTVSIAAGEGCKVVPCARGRAAQMNQAAREARGSVLYFLHADTIPPNHYAEQIVNSVGAGSSSGCFQLEFDVPHWFLQANAWFTRFDVDAFRYGDQSFFIRKDCFEKISGFSEKHILLEDQDIIKRAKAAGHFEILPSKVTTSARKYVQNGVFKMQSIFYLIYLMYRMGFSQQYLLDTYRKLIAQDKL